MSSILLTEGQIGANGDGFADEPFRPRSPWRKWLLAVAGLWLLTGVFLVAPDQQAVVTTWGAVTSPRVLPGLHYALPWPIQQVYKLKVNQLRRTVIGGDGLDIPLGRLQPSVSEFLSGDQNLLNVRVVAQYSVSEPRDYLFRAAAVDRVVGAVVESELARRLAHTAVDSIMTTEKVAIQNDVMLAAQRCLEDYHVGVSLSSVNIENVAPPPDAADAFRDVAGARADAIRYVSEAQGYANNLLPLAQGQADQMVQEAQAYKGGKVNHALGDAARFDAVAAEYAKAPEVTGTRVYVEAMEKILPQLRKLIVDSNGNFDLSIIGKDEDSGDSRKMIRRIDAKAVLTVAVLAVVFAVAWLRANHWQVPFSWSGWRSLTIRHPPASPEDGIYAMFDAARSGDAKAYLDCFSGPLRDQLAATAKEDTPAKFKAYLVSQNSAVQGMAVTITDRPNPDEARARVEYVCADHNEIQNVRLTREGPRWKIVSLDGAQPLQPLLPYGAKATD